MHNFISLLLCVLESFFFIVPRGNSFLGGRRKKVVSNFLPHRVMCTAGMIQKVTPGKLFALPESSFSQSWTLLECHFEGVSSFD